MDKTNSFIAAEDGKIIFLGRKVLSYLNLKTDRVFAYPDGTFNKGDLVLYIDFNCGQLIPQEKKLLPKIGIDQVKPQLISVGIYDNEEIQSVQKSIDKKIHESKNVSIDTIFNCNRIMVSYNPADWSIHITVNNQRFNFCMGAQTNALFCFNDDGIKYFNYSKNHRILGLENVLNGQPYLGYSQIQDYSMVDIKETDIFQSSFVYALHEARKHQAFMAVKDSDKHFYIFANKIKIRENFFYQYYIGQKQDFLVCMSSATNYYRALVKSEYSLSNNTLASGFRLWGQDSALVKIKSLLQKACVTSITILLTGESGTGKTFLAKEIHQNSKRNKFPFIHVNCAAIPYQLIESELFGYEEGSFTGAKKGGKKGYFELAQNGTIFLDEITEMPLSLQGKLLEVIQNKTFYRVGGSEKININVRFIVATNRNLKKLVEEKQFREDLYYRINVFPVELPPLRSRKDALIEIINDVLPEICENIEIEPLMVSNQAMEKLRKYRWPGNIRELENVLAKAAIMCDGKIILPEDIEFQEDEDAEIDEDDTVCGTYKKQKEFYEKKIIQEALKKYNGQRIKTAEYLGIGRTNLFEKIKKYGLEEFESNPEE
ncbi:sigma-54 interaction domain-containing protein [Aminipila luticellarii]|uniref:Sigma-54-dependent Fis family transcriptional regulator n=1 Tax=Aminipila luticellarii TaxID=2507160 RepID=A0A410PU50_9FIRM|nr:sigma-54 dependent transcriptional regulator [Aminipila luticellarii]QAT42440.1 sigma-54-dependent Fis family transcriptional regulator [Aminipila luticellarii]